MNSHESRESRFDADECDGDRPADLDRRPEPPAPATSPGEPASATGDVATGEAATGDTTAGDAALPRADDSGGPAGHDDPADEDARIAAAFAEADIPFGDDEDEAAARAARWDADDPRRKDDSFAPPTEPCECHCLHCGRTFSSDGIWFQRVINDPDGFKGFWMCPTANCSGAGFTFDIFPTDPDHPANEGWHSFDDEDEEETARAAGDEEDDEFEDDDAEEVGAAEDGTVVGGVGDAGRPPFDDELQDNELFAANGKTDDNPFGPPSAGGGRDAGDHDADEYDPDEPRYKALDALYGDEDDDDLEGEEWKYGLQPGERPADSSAEQGRREWEREQRMYDEPDQRPRVLDWSDRQPRDDRRRGSGFEPGADGGPPSDGQFKDDDIPF
jgi:hypothetical protein